MRPAIRTLLATTTAAAVLLSGLTAVAQDRYGPDPEFDDAYAYSRRGGERVERREAVQVGGESRYEQRGGGYVGEPAFYDDRDFGDDGYEDPPAYAGEPAYGDDGYGGRASTGGPLYAGDDDAERPARTGGPLYADEGYGRGDAYAYRERGGGSGYRREEYRSEGYSGRYEDGEYREERWAGGGGYEEGYGWRDDERGGERRVKRKWTCANAPVEKAWKMGCPGAGELRLSGDFFYGATGGVGPEYIDGGGGGGGGVAVAGAGAGAGAFAYAQAGASVNIRIGGGKRRGHPGKPGHPPKGGGGCGKCK